MTKDEQRLLSELANALQTAAPLSTALRQGLGNAVENAVRLEAAVDRAVNAVKHLQPRPSR